MANQISDEFDIELSDTGRTSRLGARRLSKNNISRISEQNDSMDSIPDDVYDAGMSFEENSNRIGFNGKVKTSKPATKGLALDDDNVDDNMKTFKDDNFFDEENVEPTRQNRRRRMPQKPQNGIVEFFLDRRLHIFFGVFCLIVGAVMAVMLLSHLRHSGADQSRAANLTVEQIAADPDSVQNVGGAVGAWLGHTLFTDALGLGSMALAVYLLILGFNILRKRKLEFWSLTFKTLLVAISVSITLGLVSFTAGTEVNWGGTHGHYVNETLMRIGGPMCAVALSALLVAALVSVYLNDIIRLYNRWNESRFARRKAAADSYAENEPRKQKVSVALENTPVIEPEYYAENENNIQSDIDASENLSHDNTIATNIQQQQQSVVIDNNVEKTSHNKNLESTGFSIDGDDPEVDDKSAENPGAQNFTVETNKFDMLDNGGAIVDNTPYDHRADLSRYHFPTLDLLEDIPLRNTVDMDEQQQNKNRIIKALADHKVTISSIKATVGPTVTLFEIIPTEGTRIAQIKRLEDDIAMTLKARGIRIIAPMPGKGTIGIEVPNNDPQTVSMRQVLASKKFRECEKPLPVALGATISNDIFVADLASMPHVLVAGATGQGKSVGLNAIIASLLYKKHPTELKFVLIDPKEVEFSLYAKLERHYLATLPDMDGDSAIITSSDRVLLALNSLCVLMDKRYALLRKAGVRNIVEYNAKFTARKLNPENGHEYMPYVVVIIDEFADLIMTAGKEIELPVTRITQKARAVGIHMVIATQRPSTNVLTGLIKANCPTRIAFRVMQMVDSRTILDRPGANQLIGRGDMLYSSGGEVERMQCAFISTDEVEALCEFVGEQIGFDRPYLLPEPKLNDDEASFVGTSHATAGGMERDPLFDEAAHFIISQSTASVSSLQRRYQIGYNRAGKIMDQMEAAGIVGPASGSKPRNILVDGMQLQLILENKPY